MKTFLIYGGLFLAGAALGFIITKVVMDKRQNTGSSTPAAGTPAAGTTSTATGVNTGAQAAGN